MPIIGKHTKCEIFCMKYVCCMCFEYPHYTLLDDLEVLEDLDKDFEILRAQNSASLLKKFLKPKVFELLKYRQTPERLTLKDVIASGVNNPDYDIGVYAPDPSCYKTFPELMFPIVCATHSIPKLEPHPRKIKFGDPNFFHDLGIIGNRIKSVRLELSRNIKGFRFPALMTKANLLKLQELVATHVQSFKKQEFKGRYVRLKALDEHPKRVLTELGLMFPEEDKWLEDGGGRPHWPAGRGIFVPDTLDFVIWVNVEDHLKVVVIDPSGGFKKCYRRMIKLFKKLSNRFEFHFDNTFGHLTVSPANLGTGLHAEIELELPILQSYPEAIYEVCDGLALAISNQARENEVGTPGQTFFLRTTRSYTVDEYHSVLPAYEGALELLLIEQRISKELRNKTNKRPAPIKAKETEKEKLKSPTGFAKFLDFR